MARSKIPGTKRAVGEPPQVEKFRDLARKLECDDDAEAFKTKLLKVARPPKPAPKQTPK